MLLAMNADFFDGWAVNGKRKGMAVLWRRIVGDGRLPRV